MQLDIIILALEEVPSKQLSLVLAVAVCVCVVYTMSFVGVRQFPVPTMVLLVFFVSHALVR
jgi:predicted membrane protein